MISVCHIRKAVETQALQKIYFYHLQSNRISCSYLSDEDVPFAPGYFDTGVYDSIAVTYSPELTRLPQNSFGPGVVGKTFVLGSTAVVSLDPEFLGNENDVQHVESIEIFNSLTLT